MFDKILVTKFYDSFKFNSYGLFNTATSFGIGIDSKLQLFIR